MSRTSSQRVTLTAVGDLMFDRRLRPPRVFYHYPDVTTCLPGFEGQIRIPFTNCDESLNYLAMLERHVHGVPSTSHATQSVPLELQPEAAEADYPLRAIAEELHASDIVFGNLECPLSDRGRRMANDMCYAASPAYAGALARAGFDVLSFANNHAFDFGEVAFFETLAALRESGVAVAGAGATLEEARKPVIFERNGVKVAFLAYSMVGSDWVYATHDECGVAPLNPLHVGQDIVRIRKDVDVIALSVHWGIELRARPWPRLVDLAHDFIDCGADIILGHHPHVPGSIEVYRERPIFYSLGNFLFGHDHHEWMDNMAVQIDIEDGKPRLARIVPIRGRFQPAVLTGRDARRFHEHIADISRHFGTKVRPSTSTGTIELCA
jgi:poly-gamma-glutamate capsule biosynthesis protein CapA/YwtB (metallophosphatase superfamily)